MSAQRIQGILHNDGWTRTKGAPTFSSIVEGGVSSTYEKDGRTVIVGLYEHGYPAVLISPRPNVIQQTELGKCINPSGSCGVILGYIQKLSDDEILTQLNSDSPWKGITLKL